jgi:hypothetical protein
VAKYGTRQRGTYSLYNKADTALVEPSTQRIISSKMRYKFQMVENLILNGKVLNKSFNTAKPQSNSIEDID